MRLNVTAPFNMLQMSALYAALHPDQNLLRPCLSAIGTRYSVGGVNVDVAFTKLFLLLGFILIVKRLR